jgi:hypothetical protein
VQLDLTRLLLDSARSLCFRGLDEPARQDDGREIIFARRSGGGASARFLDGLGGRALIPATEARLLISCGVASSTTRAW